MVADRVQAAKFGLTAKLYFEELNEKARNVEWQGILTGKGKRNIWEF
ncbi:unnamed protein product [Pocillopora meandrina]|uniref:Uncharacterized protein n=1 Tax=Pocillopora meandrina TaxID=46732 RepID=A0AAU9WB16_9CNID|nr:unnamed protein product [Pocillopora meandrina]